jgi:hypothetical protein
VRWSYAVIDEGHKIRNPSAAVTEAAKRVSILLLYCPPLKDYHQCSLILCIG